MPTSKPHAPATERNREPILAVLSQHLVGRRRLLEIGSGSGQHAVHFAAALPQVHWQCSDLSPALPGIAAWLDEAALPNTPAPVALDVGQLGWTGVGHVLGTFDALFSANTLHIMAWPEVEALFRGMPALLEAEATVVIYGPFNYAGRFTSESNAQFDQSLKRAAPHRGIRDFEAVDRLARSIGLTLIEDVAMPANNRCLVWQAA